MMFDARSQEPGARTYDVQEVQVPGTHKLSITYLKALPGSIID